MKKVFIRAALSLCLLTLIISSGFGQASNFGVNLAGLEFGTNIPGIKNVDYFAPTASELDYYKSKGLKTIRLPFLWERLQPTLSGPLNATYLGYIDVVVAAAAAREMSIILDVHNFGRYNGSVIGSATVTSADFQNLWEQLATHYKDEPAVWAYDLMNEPHNMGSVSWFSIAQDAITKIRTVDASHVILVEGDNWAKGSSWLSVNDNLKNLSDPSDKLVFSAHQYFDFDESGRYTNSTVAGNGSNANTGVAKIKPFVDWLQTNNLQGLVGEYGVPNNNDKANWNTLLDNFLSYLKQNCVSGTYWAGGPAWGNYIISCEPASATDKSMMAVLEQYTDLASGCSNSSSNIVVTLTSPANKTTINDGSNLTLTADASTTDGSNITKVDFYANNILIGSSNTIPYSFTWNDVVVGNYIISAKATTDGGSTSSSKGINVSVAKTVYSAVSKPVIDGIQDAIWDNYPTVNLSKVIVGSIPGGAADLSASWKATYDNTNLYVLVTVKDSKLYNNHQDVYKDDGIEIYVDMGNTKSITYGPKQFQYAFRWNDNIVNEYKHNAKTGVVFAQTTQGITPGCSTNCVAEGYTVEVQIPWSTLGSAAPASGVFEGFEVMVNDNDTGSRTNKLAWTPDSDNAWQEPLLFGTIFMETVPCTVPLAEITVIGSDTVCLGNSVSLEANTGATFSYQWYNNQVLISGATDVSYSAVVSGNYTVAITDNACTASSANQPVGVNDVEAQAGPDQFVATTTATFIANVPFTNNTGSWTLVSGTGTITNASLYNSAVSGLSQGANTFQWTLSSDSCGTSSDEVVITVGDAPSPSALTGPASVSSGQTAVTYSFTPSDANDDIFWKVPTGVTITNAAADSTWIEVNFGTSLGGSITVFERSVFATTSLSKTITVVPSAIDPAVAARNHVNAYPNPYNESSIIYVANPTGDNVQMVITDSKGAVVQSKTEIPSNTEVKIGQSLPVGLYFVTVDDGESKYVVKLFKVQ